MTADIAAKPTKIGLLAGWGNYPLLLARAFAEQGIETHCVAVKEHADPELESLCASFQWVGLAKTGAAIRCFRQQGITRAVMAGKIHKFRLFQPWAWIKHLPDYTTLRCFVRHFVLNRSNRRDDTLLGSLVREFARAGITFFPATDLSPTLLMPAGLLTHRAPSQAEWNDIQFGWRLAKELGRFDVGQSAVVRGETALAVEGIEGTDECIRRAGGLCREGGLTVVKVAKPQQDMRFDVPTVGQGTLETMLKARATCLAIEAGATIVLDDTSFCRFADRHRLAVVVLTTAQANARQIPDTISRTSRLSA